MLQAEGTAWAKTWQGSRSLLLRGWKDIPEGWDSMHGGGGAAAKQDGGVLRDPTMQDPMGCGKGGCCPPEDLRVKHGQVCLCQRTIANSAHWHGLLCSLGM